MDHELLFMFSESEPEFNVDKPGRTKLYGSRDLVAVNPDHQLLHKGYLDEWGSVVISSTGMGYLDGDKCWRERASRLPLIPRETL